MERQIITVILIVSIATLIHTVDAQTCGDYGFFCDSCSTVQMCQSNIPTGVSLTCPDGTYCDQTSSAICSTTNCTSEPHPFYECEAEGRFAWVYNCSEYIWCVNNSGIVAPTLNSCPATTVFNPNTASCVLASSYDCVDVTTTAFATESTTATESPTETTTSIESTTATESLTETTTSTESTTTTESPTETTTSIESTTATESPTETTTSTESTTTTESPTETTTSIESTTTTESPTETTTSTESTTTTESPTETTTTSTESTTTTESPTETTTSTESTTTTESSTETTTTSTESTPTSEETTTTTEATTTTTEATTTTTQAPDTTTVTTTTTTLASFVCTAYGRFAITTDRTCQSYYFCYLNDDGTYTLDEFVCPTTTVFNPTTAKCVAPTAYTCTN